MLSINDGLAILQRPDLDLVALEEWAPHHNLVGRSQAVGVLRPEEPALNVHCIALDDPKLSLAVEARLTLIESNDMRIAPENTSATWRRSRGKRGSRRSRGKRGSHRDCC